MDQPKTEVSAEEVRAARKYLMKVGIRPSQISPRLLAGAAKETGRKLRQTLELIGILLAGGQNQTEQRQNLIREKLK